MRLGYGPVSEPLITPKAPVAFLGPEATQVVESISDPTLRLRAIQAVNHCAEALESVDRLNLDKHEAATVDSDGLVLWEQLAPLVRNVLVTVGRAGDRLKELFPVDEPLVTAELDLDAAFDEFEEEADPIRDQREDTIDTLLRQVQSTEVEVALAIDALASMLQRDFVRFGQRLRIPKVTVDRWVLLGELQELKSKCQNCLEAVVAAIISSFGRQDLSTMLPRFKDATQRAVRLRAAYVDLEHEVQRLNARVKTATAVEATALRDALTGRLSVFLESEAYGYVRPADRRELSKFRLALTQHKGQITDLMGFRQLVEGFEKFLEVARSVSRRETLGHHDRSAVQTALMLWESEEEPEVIFEELSELYGRDPELDALLRDHRDGREPALEDLMLCARQIELQLRGF